MVKSKAAPRLDEQSMAYKVHVLTHATTSSGIAKIIGKKAKELHAHCITMAHHQKSALKVRTAAPLRDDTCCDQHRVCKSTQLR